MKYIGSNIWVSSDGVYFFGKPTKLQSVNSQQDIDFSHLNGIEIDGWINVGMGCWFSSDYEFNYWFGKTPPIDIPPEKLAKKYISEQKRLPVDRVDRLSEILKKPLDYVENISRKYRR